jgi:hypothetical protein
LTKVVAHVDVEIVVYPNGEMLNMSQEEYERSAIQGIMEVYYTIYEDLEEISND